LFRQGNFKAAGTTMPAPRSPRHPRNRAKETGMKELILAVAFCVLIGGCAYRHETVVERPAPALQPTSVVVTDPPPPPPPTTVYVPARY
jgi:hypothetical protein